VFNVWRNFPHLLDGVNKLASAFDGTASYAVLTGNAF
jgi:hypothetical protein